MWLIAAQYVSSSELTYMRHLWEQYKTNRAEQTLRRSATQASTRLLTFSARGSADTATTRQTRSGSSGTGTVRTTFSESPYFSKAESAAAGATGSLSGLRGYRPPNTARSSSAMYACFAFCFCGLLSMLLLFRWYTFCHGCGVDVCSCLFLLIRSIHSSDNAEVVVPLPEQPDRIVY